MIKDTNPDHYKADGANFIEYMNDPKISGFGNWMFANGFNSGVWASSNWISVKDRLPEKNGRYLVYENGEVYSAEYEKNRPDSEWTDDYEGYFMKVSHWMPLPEPPEEEA